MGPFNCVCLYCFVGLDCGDNTENCNSDPCDPTGTETNGCGDLLNDYECNCKDGYMGKNCSVGIMILNYLL